MATKLTKPVVREVLLRVEGNNVFNVCVEDGTVTPEGPVLVTMSTEGLELRRKGTGRKLFVPWGQLGRAFEVPGDAPAKYCLNPLGWLVE